MPDLNPRQFRQQRLFAPLGMKKQPHQMTPMEFADSPRTWWHASDSEDFEDIRSDSIANMDFEEQGFHVGSLGAAHERVQSRRQSGSAGFLHPVRIRESEMENTKERPGQDRGDDWGLSSKPAFYKNDFEDKGSISAVVESPLDVTHYADYVHDALDRGGIPSGQAEHFATRLDNEENQYSPGFPRERFEAAREPGLATGPRRLRPREDALLGPVQRVQRSFAEKSHQPAMLTQVDTFNEQGYPSGKTWEPSFSAVPSENIDAVHRQHWARKQPWIDRMEREAQRNNIDPEHLQRYVVGDR